MTCTQPTSFLEQIKPNPQSPCASPMAVGYVLINVEPGTEFSVHSTASNMDGIEDATLLFGEYDILVKIIAEQLHDIAALVVEQIRQIPGVTNTKTLAGAEY